MATKILKITGLLVILLSLTGCPGDEDCIDQDHITTVDDLIIVSPILSQYNVGDVLTLQTTVPAVNTFFGTEINLFEQTNDLNAFLLISSSELFTDNQLTFLRGSQGERPHWLNVVYNNGTKSYDLKVEIKLNKSGVYSIHGSSYIAMEQSSDCNRFKINTNIQGWNDQGRINFVVE